MDQRRDAVTSVDVNRTGRPREVVIARAFAIIATVLWAPLARYLGYTIQFGGPLVLCYAIAACIAVKGRPGARIVTTIASGLIFFVLLPYCWRGFHDPYLNGPGYAVMDILATLAAVTALVLLYHPNSNRYFRQSSAVVGVTGRRTPTGTQPPPADTGEQ
jgi:hypothetical protein